VQRGALGRAGTATYVDELYRTLLRRPAEQTAIRAAHAALVAGGLSRAELAERIVRSREFAEVRLIEDILRDLPEHYTLTHPTGPDTTERVVEIPWMLSRWRGAPRVLDVGYAFASDLWLTGLLDRGISDLHGADMAWADVPGMHGVQADARALPYRDAVFDLVYCVSTLEHIGKSNARYGLASEIADPGADVRTLRELARVLSADGRILVSVPFGRREDHGWLVQYDEQSWTQLVASAGLETTEQEIYRLTPEGWVLEADPGAMADLSYGEDAPAARGVLCTVLLKPGD
jgi:O-antigen chain-terminating methyltransferase